MSKKSTDRPDWGSVSVNRLTGPRVERLCEEADQLRLVESRLKNGCRILDAGIAAKGGLEAGRRIAEVCMGGLGVVGLGYGGVIPEWPIRVNVHSTNPVLACLGSQYAGWSLSHGEGKSAFHALGSGPGRVLAQKEDLFAELGYKDSAEATSLVLEVDQLPPEELTEKIAKACAVEIGALTLILTPNRSLAGTTQVVARVLEVAMHKAHALEYPLHEIVDGFGSAPISPPSPDFVEGMGRTNDAILYGGHVHLFVDSTDKDAEALAKELPSGASRDYGRPFAETFAQYKYNFFDIDPMLFSPAQVTVSCVQSGRTFHGGSIDPEILRLSFGHAQ